MLSPVRPERDDPRYEEKMAQFKKDQADRKAHPEFWGVVRHAANTPPGAGEDRAATTNRSGKKDRS